MKINSIVFILLIAVTISSKNVYSQEMKTGDKRWSVVLGLNQPLVLRGFNFELNYYAKKIVLDYSHGFGLHLDGAFIGGEANRQQLDFKVTHSLGFGIGYRITRGLNIRLEPKLHIFEMYYQGEVQTASNRITTYSTFTLGAGLYYRWLPFERKNSFLKGITLVPSVRYWPNVYSTLGNNEYHYFNKVTGKDEVHQANNIGISNTPLILNISIGYSF